MCIQMRPPNIHIWVQTPNIRIPTWSQKHAFTFECSGTSLTFVFVFPLAVELWCWSGGTDRHWPQCPHQTSAHLTQWELHSECEYRRRYPALEVPQSPLITVTDTVTTSVVSREPCDHYFICLSPCVMAVISVVVISRCVYLYFNTNVHVCISDILTELTSSISVDHNMEVVQSTSIVLMEWCLINRLGRSRELLPTGLAWQHNVVRTMIYRI